MKPTNREEFKRYILTELGAPVLNINIDEEQLENQVDKALDFFSEWHGDGTEKTYLKQRVTATVLTVLDTTGFIVSSVATTSTGKIVRIHSIPSSTQLEIITDGAVPPVAGETLLDPSSAVTTTIVAVVIGNIDNGWLPVNQNVVGITKVYPITAAVYGPNIFDIRYQLRMNDLYDLYSSEMTYYVTVMQHLALIDNLLLVDKQFRYNKLTDRLYVDMDWKHAILPGEYIVADAYVVTDPALYTKVWNDRMLKKLATAYTKRIWGINMKRYQGVVIVGGLTMNGQQMFEEAEDEIEKIETQIQDQYCVPPTFFMM